MASILGAIGERTHPLLVDLILENIFSALSTDEEDGIGLSTLLKCREVCQKWKSHATIKIESLATIKFECNPNESISSLSSYIKYLNSDSELRCTNFSFHDVPFMNKIMSHFLKIQGPNIKEISLHFKEEETQNEELEKRFDTQTFRELLQTTLGSLENLKILQLPVPVIEKGFRHLNDRETLSTNIKKISISEWQNKASALFYEDLLLSAPHLQTLEIRQSVLEDEDDVYTHGYGNLPQLISIIPGIAAAVGNHLRHVDIWKPVDLESAMPLSQLSSLVSLSFRDFLIGQDGSQFKRFLEPLSKILKYLHLNFVTRLVTPTTPTIVTPISFPVMPNLLELTLTPSRNDSLLTVQNHLHLEPIHYREIFPKLKYAYLDTHKENFDSMLSQNCEPHRMLDFLNLNLSKEASVSEIMRASHIFQKISKLEVDDGSLGYISDSRLLLHWSQSR